MSTARRTHTFNTRGTTRLSQIVLLVSVAIFFTLVVFNNTTDFDSNYQFVHHVLAMDATFPGNHGLWRALHLSSVQLLFYIGIILWEALNACLLWSGAFILWRSRRSSAQEFYEAKRVGILALTAGLLLWMVAFLCVGGEYFLMWQSKVWNGQEAASRMFLVEACVLLLLLVPEPANRTANSDQTGIQGEPSQ